MLIMPWPLVPLKLLMEQFSMFSLPVPELASIRGWFDASSLYTNVRFFSVVGFLTRNASLFLVRHVMVTPSTACSVTLSILSKFTRLLMVTSDLTSITSPSAAASAAALIDSYSVVPINTCADETALPASNAAIRVNTFFINCIVLVNSQYQVHGLPGVKKQSGAVNNSCLLLRIRLKFR